MQPFLLFPGSKGDVSAPLQLEGVTAVKGYTPSSEISLSIFKYSSRLIRTRGPGERKVFAPVLLTTYSLMLGAISALAMVESGILACRACLHKLLLSGKPIQWKHACTTTDPIDPAEFRIAALCCATQGISL